MSRFRNRKSQVFSSDLIVGISIGIILFGIMAAAWSRTSASLSGQVAYDDMVHTAMMVSDVLVKDSSLGIVSAPYVVSQQKLDEFISADYDALRDRFNIKPKEFYFSLSVNNTVISEKGSAAPGKPAAAVRRAALYNGSGAVIDFRIKEE